MSDEAGKTRVRVCGCGEELLSDGEVCPECGAKWAGRVKVRIRKRKRRRRSQEAEAGRDKRRTGALATLIIIILGLLVAALCALWSEMGALLARHGQPSVP